MDKSRRRVLSRPEHLAVLAIWLRGEGFVVSPGQLIAGARLLSSNRAPGTDDQLGPWLAPIFCTNATEQDRFTGLFTTWLELQRPSPINGKAEKPSSSAIQTSGRTVWDRVPFWTLVLMAFVVLATTVFWQSKLHATRVLALGDGAPLSGARVQVDANEAVLTDGSGEATLRYRHWQLPLTIRVTHPSFLREGELLNAEERVSAPKAAVEIRLWHDRPLPPVPVEPLMARPVERLPPPLATQGADRVHLASWRVNPIAIACEGLMLVLPIGWWLFTVLRKRGFLERMPSAGNDAIARIEPIQRTAISNLDSVREVVREMRRRIRVPSRNVDVRATLAATLRRGGPVQLVFGSRVEPEYLILVERRSREDHLSRLADEFIQNFITLGASVDRYEYSGDPSYVNHAPMGRIELPPSPQSLGQLHARHPDARLLIFSDGHGLIDRYSGRPSKRLRTLLSWSPAVLLTPQPRKLWGLREWLLGEAGLAILTLDADGLTRLGDLYRQERLAPRVADLARDQAHATYDRDLDMWLDRIAPPRPIASRLLADLERDLGLAGMAWLSACAVYPEIHWSLTKVIGGPNAAVPEETVASEALSQLARVPWLRSGFMPDWLRSQLVDRLSKDLDHRVRTLLNEILSPPEKPAQSTPDGLSVASRKSQSLWDDVRAGWRSFRDRRPAPKAIEDRVFLRFMSGPRNKLAVEVSDAVSALFYRRGFALGGPRVWPVVATLAAVGLACWYWPPVADDNVHAPGAVRLTSPASLALDTTGSQLLVADDQGGIRWAKINEARSPDDKATVCEFGAGAGIEAMGLQNNTATLWSRVDGVLHVTSRSRASGDSGCGATTGDSIILVNKAEGYVNAGDGTLSLVLGPLPNTVVADDPILCSDNGQAVVTRIGRRFIERNLLGQAGGATMCAIAPNGTLLAVVTNNGVLAQYALRRGRGVGAALVSSLLPNRALPQALAVSDTGSVAVVLDPGNVMFQTSSGSLQSLGTLDARAPISLSSDGTTMAFANSKREVEVLRLEAPPPQASAAPRPTGNAVASSPPTAASGNGRATTLGRVTEPVPVSPRTVGTPAVASTPASLPPAGTAPQPAPSASGDSGPSQSEPTQQAASGVLSTGSGDLAEDSRQAEDSGRTAKLPTTERSSDSPNGANANIARSFGVLSRTPSSGGEASSSTQTPDPDASDAARNAVRSSSPAPSPPPVPFAEKRSLGANVTFTSDSAAIRREMLPILQLVLNDARRLKLEVVIVVAHADALEAEGIPQAAQALSVRRAEAIKDFLIKQGLEANRIYTEGKGSAQPIASGVDVKSLAANRRVEFEIVGTQPSLAK